MRTYEEVMKETTRAIKDGTFTYSKRDKLDYTGVGFGYNLKDHYPKTWEEAQEDAKVPTLKELLKEVEVG